MKSLRCILWSTLVLLPLVCGFAAAADAPRANTFSDVADWKSLVITHERLGCFGSCPAYRVEIHGDGTVLYKGTAFVTERGERRSTISVEMVQALVGRFRRADFFSLNAVYAKPLDCEAAVTSIAFDGHFKSVENQCGASTLVSQLEGAIDRAANIESWIKKPLTR